MSAGGCVGEAPPGAGMILQQERGVCADCPLQLLVLPVHSAGLQAWHQPRQSPGLPAQANPQAVPRGSV